jgi:hypothetical protein
MTRLGIHTRVEDINDPQSSHAWITFDDGETREDYALYPTIYDADNHHKPMWDSDLVHNTHADAQPTTSLYAELSPQQEDDFQHWMYHQLELVEPKHSPWHYNSAHFARDAWEAGTGQRLEIISSMPSPLSDRPITIASPVGLEQSIRYLKLQPDQERIIAPDTEKTRDAPAPAPETVSMLRQGKDFGHDHDH